jgi:hypothetical protein
MEATGGPADGRPLRDRIRRAFATRAIRFPVLLALGAGLTWLASFYVQRNYIDLCERLALFPSRCAPVSLITAYSVGLAVAGLAVETAISNYPLLAGVIYLAGAAALSLT